MMFAAGFIVAEVIACVLFVLALSGHMPFLIVSKYWFETDERWSWWRENERHGRPRATAQSGRADG
jgi:hypothetical protein